MLFNPVALREKERLLDSIRQQPELLRQVLASHFPEPFEVLALPRVWEPGGGASLFEVRTSAGAHFLKVKSTRVLVESRLECEPAFSDQPSLRNEHRFLEALREERHIPRALFYEERGDHSFLLLERLESLEAAASRLTAEQFLTAWEQLEAAVRRLFAAGIVHTDIHEKNICFRGDTPVLCDFEEAKRLRQEVRFEESLDYAGRNRYGDVGAFPPGRSQFEGLTCLARLKRVFQKLMAERLPRMLEECHFDNSCPFNQDALQAPDSRVYQSISLPGLRIRGQRPMRDARISFALRLLARLGKSGVPIRHLDLGSNLGVLVCLAAQLPQTALAVGVEAFDAYVRCARVLRFLFDAPRARFEQRVCGDQSLSGLLDRPDLVTMFSIYHHVQNRERLLRDLDAIGTQLLLAEFATQERYYERRGGLEAELTYLQREAGLPHRFLVGQTADYQRPMILFSREPLGYRERIWLRSAFRACGLRTLPDRIRPFLSRLEGRLRAHLDRRDP